MLMRAATVVYSLAGLVLCFIACFVLLVIAPLCGNLLLDLLFTDMAILQLCTVHRASKTYHQTSVHIVAKY